MGMSAARADQVLTETLDIGGTGVYLWAHTDDPGVDGSANVAQSPEEEDIVRKLASFGAPGNHPSNPERRSLSTTLVEWDGAEIEVGQDITHVTVWSAETEGDCEYITALAVPKTTGSDGLRIAIGAAEVAIGVYAKPE